MHAGNLVASGPEDATNNWVKGKEAKRIMFSWQGLTLSGLQPTSSNTSYSLQFSPFNVMRVRLGALV